ncbi:MAG: hypothetical protein D6758_10845 [Gammaproteobacteria bacterium]|nr:MAG: hypothetical protein D6758_10845 [Gammaproteobacteria bacterium]
MIRGILIGCLALWASWVQAEHLPPLRVAVPSFAPFAYEGENGQLRGAMVKVLRQIERQYEEPVELVRMPYARLLEQVATGRLDAALIFSNPALAQRTLALGPVSVSRVLLFCSSDAPKVNVSALEHLGPLAVIRGASFGPLIDDNPGIQRVEVDTYVQGWRLLQLGRVKGIVGSEEGVLYAAEEAGVNLSALPPPMLIGEQAWMLHLSRQSVHYGNWLALEAAVKAVQRPGLIRDLSLAEPPPRAQGD